MHDARVLVVDDSAAMRALFSGILDQAKGVEVVGTANDADDARVQIANLRPNVVTLDVEMPGLSGIEFLEEIMADKPMPVVMLSSLTQSGTETSLKALELGAVECFPKPLNVSPEQFAKVVGKLGKIVHAAANSNVRDRAVRPRPRPRAEAPGFEWNGQVLALAASMGGIDVLTTLLAGFPAGCPPTVIVLETEPQLVETFITKLDRELPFAVKAASDGAKLEPGHVFVAFDPERHVVVEPGNPPALRLVERDPVDGARPSATLLFGSIAKAGIPAAGAMLSGVGQDGARGLLMMRNAGCATYAQDRATATFSDAPAAAIETGAAEHELAVHMLAEALVAGANAL